MALHPFPIVFSATTSVSEPRRHVNDLLQEHIRLSVQSYPNPHSHPSLLHTDLGHMDTGPSPGVALLWFSGRWDSLNASLEEY